MSNIALDSKGMIVVASDFDEKSWLNLKDTYVLGEYVMPCCNQPAIPKTSTNFNNFFAHRYDGCSTDRESLWHILMKKHIEDTLISIGVKPEIEYQGGSKGKKWIADIFFEYGNKSYAIEIQRSSQTLRNYMRRQGKYSNDNVSAIWILPKERFIVLCKAIGKMKLKNTDLSGTMPCLPELPVVYSEIEDNQVMIKGAGGLQIDLNDWLVAVLDQTFVFVDDQWEVR